MTEDERIENQILDLQTEMFWQNKLIDGYAYSIEICRTKINNMRLKVDNLHKQKQRIADERREKGRMI